MSDANTEFPELNTRWILKERGLKNHVSNDRPYAHLMELEKSSWGEIVNTATIFLTNRECPFRCLMCDLWKNTTNHSLSSSDIMRQIDFALSDLGNPESRNPESPERELTPEDIFPETPTNTISQWKLYNSGNFFDKRAIPPDTLPLIADRANGQFLRGLKNLVVESHPSFIGRECFEFASKLRPSLEVAMGLETIHPQVLPKLNKQMSLDDFQRATVELKNKGIQVRAFVLLRPPFMTEKEGVEWAIRSTEWAFEIGVDCCAVIPTRTGNGAIDRLAEQGRFEEPKLQSLEFVQESLFRKNAGRNRLLVDLWDAKRFSTCDRCFDTRIKRMNRINIRQEMEEQIVCGHCGPS